MGENTTNIVMKLNYITCFVLYNEKQEKENGKCFLQQMSFKKSEHAKLTVCTLVTLLSLK